MSAGKSVTWTLTQNEHKWWLAQARAAHLSVGEYIYVCAMTRAAELQRPVDIPGGYAAMRDTMHKIAAAKERRRAALHA